VRRDAQLIREELDLWRQQLPAYKSRILELLCDTGKIRWVAQQPVSELNAFVEYPKEMVALVIKPPGGSVEFEIKRCRVPGPQPSPLSSNARAPKFTIIHAVGSQAAK